MDNIQRDILTQYNRDLYSRMGSDVSVTELLKPCRAVHLKNRHRARVTHKKIDNLIPALTGSGLHDQLQRYLRKDDAITGNWMIERHMMLVNQGVRISGRFDALYKKEDLYDIKVTRCWKYMKGDYSEWETQLNIYDYMLWKDGISLKNLKILIVLLDWKMGQLWKAGYPQSRAEIISINRWSREEQEKYISTKVKDWKLSKLLPDDRLPLCTAEERWANAPVFKLYKNSKAKRATKNFPTRKRAEAYMEACKKRNPTDWAASYIQETRKERWRRCEDWCEVADFCNQWRGKLEP